MTLETIGRIVVVVCFFVSIAAMLWAIDVTQPASGEALRALGL